MQCPRGAVRCQRGISSCRRVATIRGTHASQSPPPKKNRRDAPGLYQDIPNRTKCSLFSVIPEKSDSLVTRPGNYSEPPPVSQMQRSAQVVATRQRPVRAASEPAFEASSVVSGRIVSAARRTLSRQGSSPRLGWASPRSSWNGPDAAVRQAEPAPTRPALTEKNDTPWAPFTTQADDTAAEPSRSGRAERRQPQAERVEPSEDNPRLGG